MSELRTGVLAIQGQDQWHDDVLIVGNHMGLQILREAIDNAIEYDKFINNGCELFQTDGEGYNVCVAHLTDDEMKKYDPIYHNTEIFGESNDLWKVFMGSDVKTLNDMSEPQYSVGDTVYYANGREKLEEGIVVNHFRRNGIIQYVIETMTYIEPIYVVRDYTILSPSKDQPLFIFLDK